MALVPAFNPPVAEIMATGIHIKETAARTGNYNPSEGVIDLVNAPIVGQIYPIFYTLFFLMILIERNFS